MTQFILKVRSPGFYDFLKKVVEPNSRNIRFESTESNPTAWEEAQVIIQDEDFTLSEKKVYMKHLLAGTFEEEIAKNLVAWYEHVSYGGGNIKWSVLKKADNP